MAGGARPPSPSAAVRDFVQTATANIEEFTKFRPSMTIWLDEVVERFPVFLDRISAEGALHAAVAEWSTIHNATV